MPAKTTGKMRGDPTRYLEWLCQETEAAHGFELRGSEVCEQALIHPRLLILGEAGCGKTVFLRQVAYAWCRGVLDARTWSLLFPILAPLPEVGANGSLTAYLEQLSRDLGWGLDARFFREKLGAALVLLDGLDSSPGTGEWIEDMAVRNPLSRFVVTARPGGDTLAGFHTVRIVLRCAAEC